MFLLIQSSDHITGLTGASPTVVLSKNGGSFASPAGAVTEVGNGWYKVAGNSTDTNTLGPLALHATAASADPSDIIVAEIVAYDPQDAVHLGLTCLPNTAVTTNASLLTSGTGTDQLSVASGRVDLGKILGTASAGTAGYVGLDWSHINAPTTTVNFSGTTIGVLTTYTGDTPQTGDVYALLNGSTTEPTSVPASTASRAVKIDYLFTKTRNKSTQTATTQLIRNNADAATIATITVSDDGTTFTKGIDT